MGTALCAVPHCTKVRKESGEPPAAAQIVDQVEQNSSDTAHQQHQNGGSQNHKENSAPPNMRRTETALT